MQPSPSAETSRLLFPSLRFRIVSPDASELVVSHLFHPVHDLAIEVLLNGEVRDGGGCRGAVPMFLTRRDPDHVTGPNLLDRRSEEHTSELQSQSNLVCRLLLGKKKR